MMASLKEVEPKVKTAVLSSRNFTCIESTVSKSDTKKDDWFFVVLIFRYSKLDDDSIALIRDSGCVYYDNHQLLLQDPRLVGDGAEPVIWV